MVMRFFSAVWLVALAIVMPTAGCGGPSAASPIAAERNAAASAPNVGAVATAESPSAASQGEPTKTDATRTAAVAAEPAAPPQPKRPPADRSPTKPGDAEKITWDDINIDMQADVFFRPQMISPDHRVKELEGKRISIIGYMHGGQAGQRGIKEFILLKNTQCKFGPGGQADHLADVKMKSDSTVQFTPSPVKVEGTLVIEPFQGPDGNTWSIYRLENAQVRN